MSRIHAFCLLAIGTSACASNGAENEIPGCYENECTPIGVPVTVTEGLIVTPLEVLEDSRCPAEAECVWEGRVVLKARLDLGHESITAELTTREPTRMHGGMLSVVEVAPYASTKWTPVPAESYRFAFRHAPDIMQDGKRPPKD